VLPRALDPEDVAAHAGRVLQCLLAWSVVSIPLVWAAPHLVRDVDAALRVTGVPVRPSAFHAVLIALVTSGFLSRKRAALWFVVLVWQLPAVVVAGVSVALWSTPDGRALLAQAHVQVPAALAAGVVGALATTLLVRARSAFPAPLARGSWWRAGAVLVGGLVAAAALSRGILQAVPHGVDRVRDTGLRQLLASTALHPVDLPLDPGPTWVGQLAGLLAAGALLAAIAVFLRSAPHDRGLGPEDELDVRRLLLTTRLDAADSLGYFATRDDRAVVWAPGRSAAVSYRVVSGVCLAAGDPLGDPDRWPAAVREWLELARSRGWAPAVLSASEQGARAYADAGLHVLGLGDEAVLDPASFHPDGRALAGVRRAVRHAEQAGYHVLVRRQADVPEAELAELGRLADLWRDGEVERGFSMSLGRFGDARDGRVVVVTAHDGTGATAGLLTFVPWGARGLSLDVMRRAPEAVGGVTELMVVRLVEHQAARRGGRVSLNFAMFREPLAQGARLGATPREKLQRAALLLASRRWQLDSLYRANEKYLPEWRTRYWCYDTAAQITLISYAAAQAEGFLPAAPALPFLAGRPAWRGGEEPRPAPQPARAAAVRVLENELGAPRPSERRLTDQEASRRTALRELRREGVDPYPATVTRTHALDDVLHALDDGSLPLGAPVSVTGRVVRVRDHGGVLFAVLRERTSELQVMFTADRPARTALWRRTVDLADHVAVTGHLVRSRTGEPTVHATSWTMAAKALRPPARALGDEARVRLRHQNLALDDLAAADLEARSAIVRALRDTLHARRFVEVETPVLQRTHGGANARPFVTHINAYDADLALRIAPELYLKRLCVGGVGRVFEIGRNFRNEGADATHNPEFTSLEAYESHGDYTTMRALARDLVLAAAVAAHGEPVARRGDDVVRLDGDWPVVTVHEAVSRAVGVRVTPDTDATTLRELGARHHVQVPDGTTPGQLVTELYEELVEPATVEPTFYTDFPVETSPLTRAHRADPRLAERWDLVAAGMELGTAYTELTDPLDQRDRLERQSLLAAGGDVEAMQVDEDFLTALEFGMPPTGGLGLGVDRLCMLLLDRSIRETLTFPFVRPAAR